MATHQILCQGVPSRMRQSATYQDPDLDEISESQTTFHCHVDQVLVVCPLLLLIVQLALGRTVRFGTWCGRMTEHMHSQPKCAQIIDR